MKILQPSIVIFILMQLLSSVVSYAHTVPDIALRMEGLAADQSFTNAAQLRSAIDRHLQKRSLPSGSDHVVVAESLMDTSADLYQQTPIDWRQYIEGVIAQYNHEYEKAVALLSKIPADSYEWLNGQLVLARTYTMMGETAAAVQVCQSLLFNASADTATLCLFDARGSQDDQLYRLIKQRPSSLWSAQLLAEYYERRGQVADALVVLDTIQTSSADQDLPVAFWGQWADLLISNRQYDRVLAKLPSLYSQASYIDDALLLRVTEASLLKAPKSAASQSWIKLMKQRIHYRLHNQASVHAYEISRYYSTIKKDPIKAVQWAQKNMIDNKGWRDIAWLELMQANAAESSR